MRQGKECKANCDVGSCVELRFLWPVGVSSQSRIVMKISEMKFFESDFVGYRGPKPQLRHCQRIDEEDVGTMS